MRLTNQEIADFDKDGYLFFPCKFSSDEAAFLKQEADNVYAMERKEV